MLSVFSVIWNHTSSRVTDTDDRLATCWYDDDCARLKSFLREIVTLASQTFCPPQSAEHVFCVHTTAASDSQPALQSIGGTCPGGNIQSAVSMRKSCPGRARVTVARSDEITPQPTA